jgi:flagellar export protein FliJ
VKRFSFSLDRVLDLRRHELEVAEARLQTIQSKREQARQGAASLEKQFLAFSDESLRVQVTSGSALQAAEGYLEGLRLGRRAQLQQEQKWEAERQSEVARVLEARRKVKLLEKLRERGERQQMAAADRQMESEAAELFLAKWVRERPIEA